MTNTSIESEKNVKIVKTMYRGVSPSNGRLENKVRELEDLLDLERDARIRSERYANELNIQLETLSQNLDEFGGANSQTHELLRKREMELTKLRKDLDNANLALENSEHNLRRKHNKMLNEFSSEIEILQKQKGKAEKDKNNMMLDIQNCMSQLDDAMKGKLSAESKLENMSSQLHRLKNLTEELQLKLDDLSNYKARISSENSQLLTRCHEQEIQLTNVSKLKITFEGQISELKRSLEETNRNFVTAQAQLNNLRLENENLAGKYESECEESSLLRNQLTKYQNDFSAMKSRLETEILAKTEECEEIRRKLNIRINELQEYADREHLRANNLEKLKTKITIEIQELQLYVDNLTNENNELNIKLKDSDAMYGDLQKRHDDFMIEFNLFKKQNDQLKDENGAMKSKLDSIKDEIARLERERDALQGDLKSKRHELEDAKRRLADIDIIIIKLENERDANANALADAQDSLNEANLKLRSGQDAVNKIKSEMEGKLRDKDQEHEQYRKSATTRIEELNITIVEYENKYKNELLRLRKKYEATINELEHQVDVLNKSITTLTKENKSVILKLKEVESILLEEKSSHDITQSSLQVSERKRVQLQGELEELQSVYEASEKSRKLIDSELNDSQARVNELNVLLTAANNEKRRIENDRATDKMHLDEMIIAKNEAESLASKYSSEMNRTSDELKCARDECNKTEVHRKKLEVELKELHVKIEELESSVSREARRTIQQLQNQILELESQMEVELKRAKDAFSSSRKYERMYREAVAQSEEDKRHANDLQDMLEKCQMRLKSYKRQIDEAESLNMTNLNKFRVAQQQAEEAEHRASMAEQHITIRKTVVPVHVRRGTSVSRELTGSVTRSTSIL